LEGFEEGVLGVEEGMGDGVWGMGEEETPAPHTPNPIPHTPNPVPQTPELQSTQELTEQMVIFNKAREKLEEKEKYELNNRNNFCFLLACSCRERGLLQKNFKPFFRRDFAAAKTQVEELSPREVEDIVHSAYSYAGKEAPHTPNAASRTPKKGRRGTDDFAMLEWLPANYNGYYDEINEHVYIRKKGETLFHPYNHRRDGSIILIELRKAGIACQSKEDVRDILFSSLSQTKNIPKEWFLNHPWDGKGDPFEAFCKRFHVKDPEYFRKTLKMWSIALVASLFEDDVVNHNIFVLQSDKQGIGKTRLWSLFLPKPLRMYYSEGVPDMRNKDAKVLMSRTLLINLDELGVLSSRSEVNNLKALLTMLGPIERGAYQEEFKKYIHRASFCAAVNDAKIITDPCGSRRHYIHHLDGIDDYNLPVPDEYWGQVFSWYAGDERYYLLPGEVQAVIDRNEAHRQMSLEEGFIRDYAIKPQPGEDAPWLSISQIVKKLTMLTGMNLDKSSHRVVGCVLTKEGYPSRIVHGYTQYQLYFKTNEQLGNESQS
jgi:hypothetical protein